MTLLFGAIGLFIGMTGTLVGAGGGFLAMPILMIFFHMPPTLAAGTSLLMVTMNAISGTLAYWKQRKIDFKVGSLLSLAIYPGSILGAVLSAYISQHLFNVIFGVVYVALAVWMLVKPRKMEPKAVVLVEANSSGNQLFKKILNHTTKVVFHNVESQKIEFKTVPALVMASLIGVQASLMGVGGGPLLVPVLIFILRFPTHLATAVSQFTIATSSLLALTIYVWHGHIHIHSGIAMGVGAMMGAPVGAWLSTRISPAKLVYILASTIFIVGIKMLV